MYIEKLVWLAPLGVKLITFVEEIHFDHELGMDEPTEEEIAARGAISMRRWIHRLQRGSDDRRRCSEANIDHK